jgi:uncharacterized membrane protein YeaQ/YmgE (transglycosylase-associated protein family)
LRQLDAKAHEWRPASFEWPSRPYALRTKTTAHLQNIANILSAHYLRAAGKGCFADASQVCRIWNIGWENWGKVQFPQTRKGLSMFLTLIGTVVIAGIVGYVSERSAFTHNGILQSIIICIGGAFLFYFVQLMFGIGFRSAGMNAILSSIGALIIVPTHWRK